MSPSRRREKWQLRRPFLNQPGNRTHLCALPDRNHEHSQPEGMVYGREGARSRQSALLSSRPVSSGRVLPNTSKVMKPMRTGRRGKAQAVPLRSTQHGGLAAASSRPGGLLPQVVQTS